MEKSRLVFFDELKSRLTGLLNPIFIVSLALLIINDHVLKGSGLVSSLLTGKLSDFAGILALFMFFSTLAGLKNWRSLSLVALFLAVLFACIKAIPSLSQITSQLFNRVIMHDPWDLLALFILIPGVYWQHKIANNTNAKPTSSLNFSLASALSIVSIAAFISSSPPSPYELNYRVRAISSTEILVDWDSAKILTTDPSLFQEAYYKATPAAETYYFVTWRNVLLPYDDPYSTSTTIALPTSQLGETDPLLHVYSYLIEGLEPETTYEIKVRASYEGEVIFNDYSSYYNSVTTLESP